MPSRYLADDGCISSKNNDGEAFLKVVLSLIGADWWRSIGRRVKSPGLGIWVRHASQRDSGRQPTGQTLLHNTISTINQTPITANCCYILRSTQSCLCLTLDPAILHGAPLLPRRHTSTHVPHLRARRSPFAIARVCSRQNLHLYTYERHYT